jgi:NAD-dependent deacetylase
MDDIALAPELITKLKSARHVAVLTGAGVSAESGVPTFRDAQTGHWAKYRPEDLATPEAFRRNPKMVWEWYQSRFNAVAGVEPNPGHHALAVMQDLFPQFTLITQNVDGLHERAGSRKVIELHGNIMKHKCLDCEQALDIEQAAAASPPPCPCGKSFYRPDVVWFGENLPVDALDAAKSAAAACDVFFCVGTATVVYPAAELPFAARRHGAVVVEVNRDATPLTEEADYVLRGPSGTVLPAIVDVLRAP